MSRQKLLENILENQFHFRDYNFSSRVTHQAFNYFVRPSEPLEREAGEAIGQWAKSGMGSINFIMVPQRKLKLTQLKRKLIINYLIRSGYPRTRAELKELTPIQLEQIFWIKRALSAA